MYEKNFESSPILVYELSSLMKIRSLLHIFLNNGTKLEGYIERYDSFYMKIKNIEKNTILLINLRDILSITYSADED